MYYQVAQKGFAADKRGREVKQLSAFICVYLRLALFSGLLDCDQLWIELTDA
jgi:hypothetical protein